MNEKIVKISDVKVNENLYPRSSLDRVTIGRYMNNLRAGAVFPPITIANLNGIYWLVDGRHRLESNRAIKNEHIQAEIINVANEKELYVESVKRNMTHGKQFTTFDVTKIIIRLEEFNLSKIEISQMVGIAVDKLEPFTASRMTRIIGTEGTEMTVLKKPLTFLSENQQEISIDNIEFQKSLSGQDQEQMISSIINLIKNDLLNPEVESRLKTLYRLLKVRFTD